MSTTGTLLVQACNSVSQWSMSTGIVLVVRITIDMGTVLASTKVVAMNRKYGIELTCRYGTY